jgi:cell division protein FtsL
MIEFVFYIGVAVALLTLCLMWYTERAYNRFIQDIEKEIEKQNNKLNSESNEH